MKRVWIRKKKKNEKKLENERMAKRNDSSRKMGARELRTGEEKRCILDSFSCRKMGDRGLRTGEVKRFTVDSFRGRKMDGR